MNVFIDKNDCEWKIGKSPIDKIDVDNELICVALPFLVSAMYPEDLKESIYSHCCKCGKSLKKGLIYIVFKNDEWGIRIGCKITNQKYLKFLQPITDVIDLLKPIIDKGCKTEFDGCMICYNPSKCTHPTCLYLLDKIEKPTIVDHFYAIRLNVFKPLVEHICNTCHRSKVTKYCESCKLVMFCDSKCREKSNHICEFEFYEIWKG